MRAAGSPTIAVRQRRRLQEQAQADGEAAFERREGIPYATATQGPGYVPCARQTCPRRHFNTLPSKYGQGFCSTDCAEQEWEAHRRLLEQQREPSALLSQAYAEMDPTLAFAAGSQIADWSVDSLIAALMAVEASRADAEGAAVAQVLQTSGQEVVKGIADKFARQPELHRTSDAQKYSDLNECYQAAHSIFPGAWASVWIAAHVAGLDADAIEFQFRNPRRIMRRCALDSSGPDLSGAQTLSQRGDFLRFAIVFPDDAVTRLWHAYEVLHESVEVVSMTSHLWEGDLTTGCGMTLFVECCLEEHVFQVEFLFSAFSSPLVQFRRSEWLDVLKAFQSWRADLVVEAILLGMERTGALTSSPSPTSALNLPSVTQWRPGENEGEGTFWAADGSVYEGQWSGGRQEGRGRYWVRDGGAYEGEWSAGKHHGQGVHWSTDGGVYRGEYVDGKRTGRGLYWFPNGCVYRGDWNGGKQHGKGIFWFVSGGVYDGGWSMGKRAGHGTYWFPDGAAQVGQYASDARNPGGIHWFADGRVQVTDSEEKGVCWSADRSLAWRVVGFAGANVVHESISQAEAASLAEELGLSPEPPAEAPVKAPVPPPPPECWLGRPPER
mmetsp:Transcript_13492/g.31739  ORF Transcript_13492/g.31739 Transcript_13492/m.31739 type:complete len:609 (-) Transcript_13492:108-1934(-)|eukprot:CAMPEP_0178444850 /NCGR_PEP_ID=MMETSP0689_2-20121128/39786_1 /TAXON_ID=160604 /ORGANISM="Amphidinium massartii, Strain CS-259" /LENGTH=608 /DNA_ID=CAMNT_0020069227 /DNA_START=23 /DNA_END=1849 /DNA_ORIENTATION=+